MPYTVHHMTVNRKKNNRQMHRNCVSYLKFFLFFAPTCFGWNSRNMSVRWIKHFKKRYAIPVHLLVIFSCINFLSCLCIFVLQDISWPSNIIMFLLILYHGWTKILEILYNFYNVLNLGGFRQRTSILLLIFILYTLKMVTEVTETCRCW